MGKQWTPADLPAGAYGYTNSAAGDLYAIFHDGRQQLLEAGYVKRQLEEAAAANKIANANAVATVSPTPSTTSASSTTSIGKTTSIKTATPDIILFDDESVPIEIMTDLIFEDIGGQELINIARRDTVNGQSISYQPIKNLSSIEKQYNPNNLISLQETSDKYFDNYSIKLDSKLPDSGGGPAKEIIYLDNTNGDIVIEFIALKSDEQIEVEIAKDGTIYEAVI